MGEIKEAINRRDFPYYSDKDYLSKKSEDLYYRNNKFKPIPHNARSAKTLAYGKNYKNTYISHGPKDMGVPETHFVSGVGSDDTKYVKNAYGRRRMY